MPYLFTFCFFQGVSPKLWRLGTNGNHFLGFRNGLHPGIDRHVNMGYYCNGLGMCSYSDLLLVYKWDIDANPDSVMLVGGLRPGQWMYVDGYLVRNQWIHWEKRAAMISVG